MSNTESNHWIELLAPRTSSDMAEHFCSEPNRFLYPMGDEEFIIRLLGEFYPYTRCYVGPGLKLAENITSQQLKSCLSGNASTIMDISRAFMNKYPFIKSVYIYDNDGVLMQNDVKRPGNSPIRPNLNEDQIAIIDTFKFINKFSSDSMFGNAWVNCIISNAYIRHGSKYREQIYPLVITKSMFNSVLSSATMLSGDLNCVETLSGLNAYDLKLFRNQSAKNNPLKALPQIDTYGNIFPVLFSNSNNFQKAATVLVATQKENMLSSREIENIICHKLINIEEFVKTSNKVSLEKFYGFIHKPFSTVKDFMATSKIIKQVEEIEAAEVYESTEKELCNLPQELTGYEHENGPIGNLEIL